MALRSFSGNAKTTSLAGDLSAAATSINVVDGTGYPTGGSGPFVVTLSAGLATEEKVLVSTRTGNTFTVATAGRGWDGTTAADHENASSVQHTFSATDAREANEHVNDTAGDPHPQYLTPAEGAVLYAPVGDYATTAELEASQAIQDATIAAIPVLHVEGKVTAGSASTETVTWTTPFETTPVVTVSVLRAAGPGNNLYANVSSVSTTDCTVTSFIDNGSTAAAVKHVIAVEAT